MEDLVKLIAEKHKLSEEETQGILITISDYIKQKFPMLEGAIDNLFQSEKNPFPPKTTIETQGNTDKDSTHEADFLDI